MTLLSAPTATADDLHNLSSSLNHPSKTDIMQKLKVKGLLAVLLAVMALNQSLKY